MSTFVNYWSYTILLLLMESQEPTVVAASVKLTFQHTLSVNQYAYDTLQDSESITWTFFRKK